MNSEERAAHNQEVSNGIEAEKLLSNELLQSIIFSQKNSACEAFMSSNRCDDKKRLDAWQNAQGVISFEASLQALVERGKIAKTLLDEADQYTQPNYNPLEGRK